MMDARHRHVIECGQVEQEFLWKGDGANTGLSPDGLAELFQRKRACGGADVNEWEAEEVFQVAKNFVYRNGDLAQSP